MLRLSDFHYDLPPSQIAQEPLAVRDQSRLLVVSSKPPTLDHRRFFELDQILRPSDVLVMNSTKVFPARLRGKKKTGGKTEVLLLEALDDHRWRALVRGATQPTDLLFPEGLSARMTDRTDQGEWILVFDRADIRDYLNRHGEMPLPPLH